jgi:large subunit ribosomal protein L24
MVISGDHKGSVGEIIRVDTKHGRVFVKGVNLVTKHIKASRVNPQGSVITKEAPLYASKVQPVVDGKPTRVRFTTKKDGSKVRVAVKGGKELGVVSRPTGKR